MPYRHDIFELKCRKTQDKRRKMKRIETKKDGPAAILFCLCVMQIKLLLSISLYFSIPSNSTSKIRLEKGLMVPLSAEP